MHSVDLSVCGQLMVKTSWNQMDWMLILSTKYLGQIKAGMPSLLECDSLCRSARDFRHCCEHCPATHSHSFSPLHTHRHRRAESLSFFLGGGVFDTHTGVIALQVVVITVHGNTAFPFLLIDDVLCQCSPLDHFHLFKNSFLSCSVWSGTMGVMFFIWIQKWCHCPAFAHLWCLLYPCYYHRF